MLTGQAKTDYMKFYMRRRRATFTIPGRIQTITELLAQSGHHKPNEEELRLELAFWEAQRNIDWILNNASDCKLYIVFQGHQFSLSH